MVRLLLRQRLPTLGEAARPESQIAPGSAAERIVASVPPSNPFPRCRGEPSPIGEAPVLPTMSPRFCLFPAPSPRPLHKYTAVLRAIFDASGQPPCETRSLSDRTC